MDYVMTNVGLCERHVAYKTLDLLRGHAHHPLLYHGIHPGCHDALQDKYKMYFLLDHGLTLMLVHQIQFLSINCGFKY